MLGMAPNLPTGGAAAVAASLLPGTNPGGGSGAAGATAIKWWQDPQATFGPAVGDAALMATRATGAATATEPRAWEGESTPVEEQGPGLASAPPQGNTSFGRQGYRGSGSRRGSQQGRPAKRKAVQPPTADADEASSGTTGHDLYDHRGNASQDTAPNGTSGVQVGWGGCTSGGGEGQCQYVGSRGDVPCLPAACCLQPAESGGIWPLPPNASLVLSAFAVAASRAHPLQRLPGKAARLASQVQDAPLKTTDAANAAELLLSMSNNGQSKSPPLADT